MAGPIKSCRRLIRSDGLSALLEINHDHWRTFMFAGLLFVAQIFIQLHGLEHIDESDHDKHGEDLCVLCIVISGLEGGYLENIANTHFQNHLLEKIEYSYSFVVNFVFDAFSVRAPPLILQSHKT